MNKRKESLNKRKEMRMGSVPICDTDDTKLAIDSAKIAFNKWSVLTAEVYILHTKNMTIS